MVNNVNCQITSNFGLAHSFLLSDTNPGPVMSLASVQVTPMASDVYDIKLGTSLHHCRVYPGGEENGPWVILKFQNIMINMVKVPQN